MIFKSNPTVLVVVILLLNGYLAAPISRPAQTEQNDENGEGMEAKDVITVTLEDICQKGGKRTIQVQHIRRDCVSIPNNHIPVPVPVVITTVPMDVSLKLYEMDDCEGTPLALPPPNNSSQIIRSLQFTRR